MLASFTQELGDDECRAVSTEIMGTGDFTSASIVKFFDLFRSDSLLSPEHIQAIIKEIYNEATGHEFARREAYLEVPLKELNIKPLLLAVEAEIRLDAIPEGGTRELAALIDSGLEEIWRLIQKRKFTERQLILMISAWRGTSNFLGWAGLESSLKDRPELRGKIAYVYARRFLVLKNQDFARRLFQLCLSDSPAQSPFRKLAQEQLDRLQAK